MEQVIDVGKGTDKVTINIDRDDPAVNVRSVLMKVHTPVMLSVRDPDHCNDPVAWRLDACRGGVLIDVLHKSIFIDGSVMLRCPVWGIHFDGRIVVEVRAADYIEALQNG
jgi:hypothetical protein